MSRNFELIASHKASKYLREIREADIMVGMPSYNNVLTANFVVSQIVEGLDKYFPSCHAVIFVSDGGSGDGTLDSVAHISIKSTNVKLVPTIYIGASGKGSALQAIFEAARYLQVKSVALLDSDLHSVTPEWVSLLVSPTLTGTDFVAPLYKRSKYDGTITNFLCYPLTTALFGKNIRQPIGGDFGLSARLVEELLNSHLWAYPDVSRFGIDIFETQTALAKGFNVKEAILGVKSHDPKDPSSQLAGMFRQVIGTMFMCINEYEASWKRINGISETEKIGEDKGVTISKPVEVSLSKTIDAFKAEYNNYVPIYRSILDRDIQKRFEKLKNLETQDVEFFSEHWIKTVYAFLSEFRKEKKDSRAALLTIDALRILWIGRVAAYMKETWNDTEEQAEAKIRAETKSFTQHKHLLVEAY
ncbi:MAG: glycosyltransferase [Betaproteobacteria bacterium]